MIAERARTHSLSASLLSFGVVDLDDQAEDDTRKSTSKIISSRRHSEPSSTTAPSSRRTSRPHPLQLKDQVDAKVSPFPFASRGASRISPGMSFPAERATGKAAASSWYSTTLNIEGDFEATRRSAHRRRPDSISRLGIKFMESLTLFPVWGPFFIAPQLTLMAG